MTSRTRHFLRGRDYYALTVMSAPDGRLPAEAERFLGSFHFGEPTASSGTAALPPPQGETTHAAERTKIADQTPEDALRTFVIAMALRDEPALRAVTLPAEGFEWLIAGPPAPEGVLKELKERLVQETFRSLKAGDTFTLARGQVVVVKPEDVGPDQALVLPQGASLPTRLQRFAGHWKVDPRGVIAGRKAAEAARKKSAQQSGGGPR